MLERDLKECLEEVLESEQGLVHGAQRGRRLC
jgi:hypothetical protein